ncbi:DNA translocase FtsK [Siminovitchia terrae]|uniref:DNA translocase FtsK n=1 Tax=Siminovitchia terrae TaxID=1914933 RepID=A0ABQ4L2R8_SIMTE|nr:DNA translocase FtsK [Siminovitchia terrae]GIN98510.1 DNA translocase FtsK [Siminovitchia terrae]
MHWWKKFLSNFFSDKSIDEQTEWHIENNHKNEQHEMQEMKTRMIYQYPKGEFRFPLIKDQPGSSIPDKQKQPIKTQQKDERRNHERRNHEKRQNRQADRRDTEQRRRKIEPKNSQPFEPTHIPSPVYGFNRPIERKVNPKSHIPEFELNDIQSKLRFKKVKQETANTEKVIGKAVLEDQPVKSETDRTVFDLDEKNEPESQNSELEIKTWRQHHEIEQTSEESEGKIPEILQTGSHEKDETPDEDNLIDQTQTELAIKESEEQVESAKPASTEEIREKEEQLSSELREEPEEPAFTKESEKPEEQLETAKPASTEEIREKEDQPSSELREEPEEPAFTKESEKLEEQAEPAKLASTEEIRENEEQLSSELREEPEEPAFTKESEKLEEQAEPAKLASTEEIRENEEQLSSELREEPEEPAFTEEFDKPEEQAEPAKPASTEEIRENEEQLSSELREEPEEPAFTEEFDKPEEQAETAKPVSTEEIRENEEQISSELREEPEEPAFVEESEKPEEQPEKAKPVSAEEVRVTEERFSSEELEEKLGEPEKERMALKQSNLNIEPALIDEALMNAEGKKIDETVVRDADSSIPELETFEEAAAAVEMSLDQEAEVAEPSMEEPAKESSGSKPRSHLPFNVLMLTQDKTNWKKQNDKEKIKSEAVSAPVKEVQEVETSVTETVHYTFPDLSLLKPPVFKEENTEWLNEQASLLDETMENFNVKARVVRASQGPSVTRFEVQPDKGVKVNKITNLSNDIKLSMAARDIRMEAPIPGTRSIGIELPNKESRPVQISEIIGESAFQSADSPLTAALGLDISGEPVVTDLRKMPHGLIAGATGSGKSVCINSILVSLLYKARPDELKLMLIDPKMVELAPYNHIPHLVSPVITDVKAATAALKWAVDEMERRYELFVHAGVRDIGRFNELAETKGQKSEHLPYIVIIIDELADLMMVAPAEVEESICRIAQKARACGIHLLIATQRPSVDVITGLIKANVPTRIAFAVSSQVDSRTVIDVSGAEKLLGRGDMLFLNNGSVKPVRLQGTFVSDEEIDRVIDHVRDQGKPNYIFQQDELLKKAEIQENEDELLLDACQFVVKQGNASTSLLQRQFRIGYNRAARLMEMMEDQGVISGAKGSKPRDVLIKEAELDLLKDSLVH